MRWQDTATYWQRLGTRNPFGVILTGPDQQPRDWDVDAFFATGVADVRWLMTEVDRVSPRLPRRSALDFGCGVGRISRALSSHFERVVGVDVARSMVRRARQLNAKVSGCEFRINHSSRLRALQSDAFDLVYSRLVLQHIPPRSARRYIGEFVRVLAPGGLLMFQLPEPLEFDPDSLYSAEEHAFVNGPIADTRLKRIMPRWMIRLYRHVRFRRIVQRQGRSQRMYMFGMSRPDVEELLAGAGAKIIRIDADQSHGDEGLGWVYWATK